MQIGDMIRDGDTGATGRIVAIFADGAWARRWPGCYRCDAVDPSIGGYTDFLGTYGARVYLIEHGDRSVALVRARDASATTGIHQALPPPSLDRRAPAMPRPGRRTGRRSRCTTCGGTGVAR